MDKVELLDRIDIAAFYESHGCELHGKRPEVTTLCRFHDDHKPSLGINVETGFYNCPACGASGDVFTFYQHIHNCDFKQALAELTRQYGGIEVQPKPKVRPASEVPPIAEEVAAKFAEVMRGKPDGLAFLHGKRGFTDQSIDLWQIGWSEEHKRVTLPIRDKDGKIANIRLYKPKASGNTQKWLSWSAGYGGARLWPMDVLQANEDILLCEGEFDTILAFQHGFCAVTSTGGSGTWKDEWTPLFAGKVVTICYDNDQAGRDGAASVAEKLAGVAACVRILQWPPIMADKGDITDFFVDMQLGVKEFKGYVDRAREYTSAKTRKMPKSVKTVLPDNGFLSSYMSYASELTDAPLEFHLATGLSVLAAATGNRVAFTSWGQDVCLNLWSVLIAPSGFYRKSTAMNIGLRLLRQACPDTVLPDNFSQEGLMDSLVQHPSGVLTPYEFGALIEHFRKEYMRGTMEALTALYDCPDTYEMRTVGKGARRIERPAINILGASTIDWLQASVKDLKGGFVPRFLFWPATQKGEWKGMTPPPNPIIQSALVDFLKDVSKMQTSIDFPADVRGRFNEWTREHEEGFNADKLPPVMLGFYTRMTTYVGKLGVLYYISKYRRPGIDAESLEAGIRLVDYLKSHLTKLVCDDFVYTKEAGMLREIKSAIAQAGRIEHSQLLKQSRMYKTDFDRVLMTLLEAEEVKSEVEKTGGRPKKFYSVAPTGGAA